MAGRKRMTQLFPWLMPIRKKQRLLFFYAGMKLDSNQYVTDRETSALPYQLFETSQMMYNYETGFDMVYQENKVFNLKLAAATIDHLLIKPGETFSFWQSVRYADRDVPYKDGLVVIDGNLTTAPGGGLCQMSNLLFWMFLHTPLTVSERHGHAVKEFPDAPGTFAIGVDATVSEGWLDLKVRNDTNVTFQVNLMFDDQKVTGRILTDRDMGVTYEIANDKPVYEQKNDAVFEKVCVNQRIVSKESKKCVSSKQLYENVCRIGYPLPEDR